MIDAGVNVVCGNDGAEGKFPLDASGDLQGIRRGDVGPKRLDSLPR